MLLVDEASGAVIRQVMNGGHVQRLTNTERQAKQKHKGGENTMREGGGQTLLNN